MRISPQLRARIALVAAIAMVFVGCRPTDRVVAPSGPGDPGAIVSEVHLSQTELRPGETMQIEVVIRNPTEQPITLHFSSGCMLMFVVKSANGFVVAPMGVACTMNAPTLVLAPGESQRATFPWDGTDSFQAGTPLQAGVYEVIGGLDPGVLRNPSSPVAIKILAK